MKVLVVGAGAVGQVWALGLHRGGAEVHFLVRPYQLSKFQQFPLRLHGLRSTISFSRSTPTETVLLDLPADRFHAFSSNESVELPESLKSHSFDVFLLTVSAASILAHGNWLTPLVRVLASGTGVVIDTSPRDDDGEQLLKATGLPRERVLHGDLPIVSWQAPLKNERFPAIPPEAYEVGAFLVLPDGTKVPNPNPVVVFGLVAPQKVSGYPGIGASVAKEFAAIMNKGGVKAASGELVIKPSVSLEISTARSVAAPILLLALEAAGWKFGELKGEILKLAVAAMKESLVLASKHGGQKPSFARVLLQTWTLRPILWLIGKLRIFSYDLEAMLAYHFTKVHAQTVLFADRYRDTQGEENVPAFQNLIRAHARITSRDN